MYAAIGVWNMEAGDWQEQQRVLQEEVVPMVQQIPGFVSGYWTDRAAGKTYTTILFEDQEAAQRFKGFVLGEARAERQDEAGVANESFIAEGSPRPIADPSMPLFTVLRGIGILGSSAILAAFATMGATAPVGGVGKGGTHPWQLGLRSQKRLIVPFPLCSISLPTTMFATTHVGIHISNCGVPQMSPSA